MSICFKVKYQAELNEITLKQKISAKKINVIYSDAIQNKRRNDSTITN